MSRLRASLAGAMIISGSIAIAWYIQYGQTLNLTRSTSLVSTVAKIVQGLLILIALYVLWKVCGVYSRPKSHAARYLIALVLIMVLAITAIVINTVMNFSIE